MRKKQKQTFALALCASLLLCSFGGTAFAEEPAVKSEKICEHHPAHTAECGYAEETAGHVCGHEHTPECYTSLAICGYSDLDAPHTHTHIQECYEIDCAHKRGEHDDMCGYIAEVPENPCGYACEICNEPSPEPSSEQESGAITVVTGFEGLEESVQYQTAESGAGLDALTLPVMLNARGYVEGEENAPDSIAVPVEKWAPDRPYGESGGPGSYLFTPVLPAGYSLSGGVELPEIYVKTGEANALSAAPRQNEVKLTVSFQNNGSGGTGVNDNEMKTAIDKALDALTTQGLSKENVTKIELTGNAPEITGYNWKYLLDRYRENNPNDNWPKLTTLDLSGMTGLTAIRNDTGFSWGQISKLKEAVLPDSLTSIGQAAFSYCTALSLTALPDGLTSIGNSAFSGCTALSLTALPDGVTSIGHWAFENCTQLALTALPKGLTNIGKRAFFSCAALSLTALPTGLTSIGEAAFYGCTGLTQITLPKSVTNIENYAFTGCTNLVEVIMARKSAPSLGTGVFSGTNSGLIIYIPQNGTGYDQGNWASLADKLKRYGPAIYVPVNGISLDQSSCSLYMGETATLTALVSPYNASVKTVSWSSDNPKVATVDGGGTVTALSIGTAVITAVSQDSGQEASCTVSVQAYPLIGGFSYIEETWEPAPAAVAVSERPVPDTPTIAEISLSTTMENQIAIGTVSDKNTQREIRNAKDAAQRKNRLSCGISVQYKAKLPENCNGFSIVLRRETLEGLIAANVTGATFSTDLAKLSFDLAALRQIAANSIGDVTLTVEKETALSGEMREAVGERPVLRFTVNAAGQNGEKTVLSSFGKGRVALEIPYTPKDEEQTGSLFLVREGENGSVEWLSQSVYDRNSGAVTVSTGHFSLFGVGYKAAPAYTDTEKHWANPDIAFAVSRKLLNGDSETTFHPDKAITRSDLAAALGRLAGIDPADDFARSFFDIPADADYAPYADWAVSNNIMSGTEGKNFSPNGAITREEMAVILQKYAAYRNVSLPALRKAELCTDADQISAGMKSAVQILRQAGVMGCKDGGRFAPRDSVTRAEAAVFLRRFVAVLTAPSANGWIQNDAGRWQYTLNGKSVAGWKQIDGNWYYFDTAGLMESGGWKRISQKQYFFYPNGVMAANAVIDGYALGPDGARKE